jgi:hypothetical protein
MLGNASLILGAALILSGCLSISSSEPLAVGDLSGYCAGKELLCREACGGVGVQSFACAARPGQEISYKCECRRAGVAM